MIKTARLQMYGNNFLLLSICLAILFLFFIFFIKPISKDFKKIDIDISYYDTEIRDQERFRQMYIKLDESVKRYNALFVPGTVKAKLPKSKLEDIPELLGRVINESHMKTVSVIPDVKSLFSGSSSLLVRCTIDGKYSQFDDLVLKFDSLSYIDHIEKVMMTGQANDIRFKFNLWLDIGV